MRTFTVAATLAVALIAGPLAASADDPPMGFFVTSTGMGDGADLGGLVVGSA